MTNNNHPITPPPELQAQWRKEWSSVRPSVTTIAQWIATKSAQWGYAQRGAINEAELQKARDEELEACCKVLDKELGVELYSVGGSSFLRAARRPKPKSQADGALILLDDVSDRLDAPHENGIRRALERLRELEKQADD